jgi:hypothetical protein
LRVLTREFSVIISPAAERNVSITGAFAALPSTASLGAVRICTECPPPKPKEIIMKLVYDVIEDA